jgi:hypothetical protein
MLSFIALLYGKTRVVDAYYVETHTPSKKGLKINSSAHFLLLPF